MRIFRRQCALSEITVVQNCVIMCSFLVVIFSSAKEVHFNVSFTISNGLNRIHFSLVLLFDLYYSHELPEQHNIIYDNINDSTLGCYYFKILRKMQWISF